MAHIADEFYPRPSLDMLRAAFVGRKLQDVQAPAAVVDRAVVERNCRGMLKACEDLHVEFRPHTKTHKTTEVTALQLGPTSKKVKLVVSTVQEAESLCEFLLAQLDHGKSVNLLYGVPLPPSRAQRLAEVGKRLGPGSISTIIDHPSQIQSAHRFKEIAGFPLQIFVKIDAGYHRAGLSPQSKEFERLLEGISTFESIGCAELIGFYSHAGNSYSGNSQLAAMKMLCDELTITEQAADTAMKLRKGTTATKLIISVGATPTAISLQNFTITPPQGHSDHMIGITKQIQETLRRASSKYRMEIHAGVYPFLDLQQLATQAGPSQVSVNSFGQPSRNTSADLALTILAEVISVYEERKPAEALIAAGTLALGREPCKAYSGWGIVSDWGLNQEPSTGQNDDGRSGWQLGRISQEHGILTKDPSALRSPARLTVGQKIRIWPNHACIAGAMFGWYLVVDSSMSEKSDEIVDVWERCRGW